MATSSNRTQWSAPTPLLDGSQPAASKLGYDTTEDDGVFSAFRDPMVFKDEDYVSNGKLHMVFATKQRIEDDGVVHVIPTVGYATSADKAGGYRKWELQPPLTLPHYVEQPKYALGTPQLGSAKIRQVEVPYVVQRKGSDGALYTYLFISTQRRPEESTNDLKEAAYRGYVSKNGVRGPYQPLYAGVERSARPFADEADKIYGSELYSPTIFELPVAGDVMEYYSSTFFSEDTKWPLTGTPLYPMSWDDKVSPPAPFFTFPRGSEILASKQCAGTAVDKK